MSVASIIPLFRILVSVISAVSSSGQEAVLNNLPAPGDRGNKLPPLQPPAPNPDVFDGTRTFEDGVDTEFFTMPGKTKVPLQPSDKQTATSEPIHVDDGEISP